MGRPKDNLIGQRFGRLIVEEATDDFLRGNAVWVCRCDCGRLTRATSGPLKSGGKSSCGCLKREMSAAKIKKIHGDRHPPNYKGRYEQVTFRLLTEEFAAIKSAAEAQGKSLSSLVRETLATAGLLTPSLGS